jgi:hypothetical protein
MTTCPKAEVVVCQRYHADGTRCTHETRYHDGWCREGDCAGFTRRLPDGAPESKGAPKGTRKHLNATGHVPVGLDPDEAPDVGLTNRAVDSFRFHHGGSVSSAEAQLRSMLEDFLLRSARRTRNGFVILARDGYELVLSPELASVTGYSTVHRERTWAQVQAGIKSRFGAKSRGSDRGPSGERPPWRAPLWRDRVAAAVNPQTVYLTARARRSFARLLNLDDVDDAELDRQMRTALIELTSGRTTTDRVEPGTEILAGGLRWLVADNATSIMGVARPRPEAT